MDPASRASFLADAMLGRLARWLRAAGFDTAYHPDWSDRALVELAARESRTLLTRDRHLLAHLRPARAFHVASRIPLEQLREVVDRCGLEAPAGLFTRCLVCNAALEELESGDADPLLPVTARGLPGPVRRCPSCGRVYWPGSHVRRMSAALARAIPEWFA